ncbi:MAG: hypothetical protein LBD53_02100, partial [Tannerella sp.]|nr:hypothetical protein [Tannerella sp.]
MYFKRFLFLFVAICLGTATMATRRYVAPTGSSTYTGLNGWSNASNDLQAMINASTVGDEIWVYAGMYKPNRPFDNRQTPPPP